MATAPTTTELQALIQQLQAQVQALQNAAATAATVAPAAPTAAPSVVVFAETPQTLGAEDLIDYYEGQTSTSKELLHSMTRHLPKAST
jgi:hypothetical protein